MELYQLQSAIAVAQLKNFTKAAEAMSVSQSALSQQIARLESELGIQLFDRSRKAVSLLPAGEEFIKHAEKIVNEYNTTLHIMDAHKQKKRGSIRIGGFPILDSYGLVSVIASFMHEYSDIYTTYTEAESLELIDMLEKSYIDVCFLNYMDFKNKNIKHIDLMFDRIVAVLDENHPFSDRKSLQLSELRDEKFILSTDSSSHYFDIINACITQGFNPNVVFSCRDINTMLGFIRHKMGISLLSRSVAEDRIEEGIVIVPITPAIPRRIILATLAEPRTNPIVSSFISHVKNFSLSNPVPGDLHSGIS